MGRVLEFNRALFYEAQHDTRRVCRKAYKDAATWLDYIELAYDWVCEYVPISQLETKVFDSLQDNFKYLPNKFCFFVAPRDDTLIFMIAHPESGLKFSKVINAAELREKFPRYYAQYVRNGVQEFIATESPLNYSKIF